MAGRKLKELLFAYNCHNYLPPFSLPTAYFLLLTAYSSLPTAYFLLLTSYCLLLTAYCLLPTPGVAV